jgi:multidrug efflux pump subunit AcrA (membrane-fusion protein)
MNNDVVDVVNDDVEQVITIEAASVSRGTLIDYVDLLGTVGSDQTVNIIPTVPAKVQSIYVKVGDFVNAGDLLFTLDQKDVQNQVSLAEIGLRTAQASVEQAQLGLVNAEESVKQATTAYDMAKANYDMQHEQYEFALDNLARYEVLYNEGIVSKSEYDQLKLNASPNTVTVLEKQLEQAAQSLEQATRGIDNAQVAIKQSEAGYSQAQQNYNQAVDALNDMRFTAPISGYISSIAVTEQQFASNGQPAIVIDAMDTIEIKANVTENLVNRLQVGQEVEITLTAFNDEVINGVIDSISSTADVRTLLYPITIEVENASHRIKPGMFASIKVARQVQEDALYILKDSVILRSDGSYVYVVKNENQVELRQIEVGLDIGLYVEILDGLSESDEVVTKGKGLISEHTVVRVVRGDN